jgi:hypothetical protein
MESAPTVVNTSCSLLMTGIKASMVEFSILISKLAGRDGIREKIADSDFMDYFRAAKNGSHSLLRNALIVRMHVLPDFSH